MLSLENIAFMEYNEGKELSGIMKKIINRVVFKNGKYKTQRRTTNDGFNCEKKYLAIQK